MDIKELTPELSLLTTGLKETTKNLKSIGNISPEKIAELITKMNNQDIHLFVAVEENNIIGILTVIIEQKLIREGAIAAHIEDVATRKGHEGKGIGTKLMQHAVKYSKERGCYKIILDCEATLEKYYERFNFETSGKFMRTYL